MPFSPILHLNFRVQLLPQPQAFKADPGVVIVRFLVLRCKFRDLGLGRCSRPLVGSTSQYVHPSQLSPFQDLLFFTTFISFSIKHLKFIRYGIQG